MLSCFYGVTVIYNLLMLYSFSQLNLFECFIISIASQIIHSRVPDLITSVLWLSVGKMFCYLSSFRFYIFGSSYVLVHLLIVLFVQHISSRMKVFNKFQASSILGHLMQEFGDQHLMIFKTVVKIDLILYFFNIIIPLTLWQCVHLYSVFFKFFPFWLPSEIFAIWYQI